MLACEESLRCARSHDVARAKCAATAVISTAILAHIATGGGAEQIARVIEDRSELQYFARSIRGRLQPRRRSRSRSRAWPKVWTSRPIRLWITRQSPEPTLTSRRRRKKSTRRSRRHRRRKSRRRSCSPRWWPRRLRHPNRNSLPRWTIASRSSSMPTPIRRTIRQRASSRTRPTTSKRNRSPSSRRTTRTTPSTWDATTGSAGSGRQRRSR